MFCDLIVLVSVFLKFKISLYVFITFNQTVKWLNWWSADNINIGVLLCCMDEDVWMCDRFYVMLSHDLIDEFKLFFKHIL